MVRDASQLDEIFEKPFSPQAFPIYVSAMRHAPNKLPNPRYFVRARLDGYPQAIVSICQPGDRTKQERGLAYGYACNIIYSQVTTFICAYVLCKPELRSFHSFLESIINSFSLSPAL